MNDINARIIRCIIYPLILYLRGWGKRIRYNKYYRSRLYCTVEDNALVQQYKLYSIVDYAVKHIAYYKQIADAQNITYACDTIYEDIKKFPILTKDIIRNNYDRLINPGIKRTFINTSGGSTGEAVRFVQDWDYYLQDATEILDELSGYRIGDKAVRLWGCEKDIIYGRRNILAFLVNRYLYRSIYLNAFMMSDDDINRYIEYINAYKPRVIIAYVQSIFEMARFIERQKQFIFSPNSIICSAGTLEESQRVFIEGIFRCKVFNRYGSREVGNIAMECGRQDGLHLNILNHYVEVADESGCPVGEGERGEALVTLLTNYAMPLIRYKIGDIIEYTKNRCSCGRGLPIVKKIMGRTVNIFRNAKGVRIDGEYFTHLFYYLECVRQFQIIQESETLIVIRLQMHDSSGFEKNRAAFDYIDACIRKAMGNQCRIEYRLEDRITPSPSGKHLYTISRVLS